MRARTCCSKVKFSSDGAGGLGTGIFTVCDEAKRYIVEQLHAAVTSINEELKSTPKSKPTSESKAEADARGGSLVQEGEGEGEGGVEGEDSSAFTTEEIDEL